MFFPTESGSPSLLVDDGKTVTVSAKGKGTPTGIRIDKFRPRTTAALLTMTGKRVGMPLRLSDQMAFERVAESGSLVNIQEVDHEGRMAGYTVPFLSGVLDGLDPAEQMPSTTVDRYLPIETEEEECRCCGKPRPPAKRSASSMARIAPPPEQLGVTHQLVTSPVPDFIRQLEVYAVVVRFGDVVVGKNGKLIFDSDVSFVAMENFFCHEGSRIVQRSPFLTLDVTGRMRGSLSDSIWRIEGKKLTVDWAKLAAQPATKP